MRYIKRLDLARESYILLAICFLDLVSTFWLVTTERAVEGNPLMSFYLNKGWLSLIAAKTMLVVLPIFIAEWGRRYRPQFVHRMLRFTIAAYIGLYAVAFVRTDMLASDRKITENSPVIHYQQYETTGPVADSRLKQSK